MEQDGQGSPGARIIRVAAVTLVDVHGRWLTVRKHGATRFMHAGGKIEAGETPRACAVREVEEELGVQLDPAELDYDGQYVTAAANEAGHALHAEMFVARQPVRSDVAPRAEIAEVRWVEPETLRNPVAEVAEHYAPLLLDQIARWHS